MELKKASLVTFALIFMFILVSLIAVHAVPIVSVSGFDSGFIDTTSHRINLDLDLVNSGDSCAKAVTVTTNSIFLSNSDSDNGPIDVCKSETLSLILNIPPNTPAGTYPIAISGVYTDVNNSRQYTFTSTINIFINGFSDINAHIVSSVPLNAYAGDTITISVLVENDGTLTAQSINGVLSASAPIQVKPAESFFSVGSLLPQQSYIASFSFDIPKDAQAQVYSLTLNLSYTEQNSDKTRSIPLTFEVKKKAMFQASDATSDILYPKDSGKILRIRITNIGTDTANQLKIQMQPQYPFTTDGSMRYIPSLLPGQSSVVQFAIDVDKAATIGNYGVNLILDYQDSQGNNLQDSVITSLSVQSKSLAQTLMSYWYLWLIEIIIFIIIITRINKKLKAKRTQKEQSAV